MKSTLAYYSNEAMSSPFSSLAYFPSVSSFASKHELSSTKIFKTNELTKKFTKESKTTLASLENTTKSALSKSKLITENEASRANLTSVSAKSLDVDSSTEESKRQENTKADADIFVDIDAKETNVNIDKRPCIDFNPCKHGSCHLNNQTGEFTCQCDVGYMGPFCDLIRHPCDFKPCENGICEIVGDLYYKCLCRPNWTGVNCHIGKKKIRLLNTFLYFYTF